MTRGLLAPREQQARPPRDDVPRTPQKHRAGVTQTTPSLRGRGYAPPDTATQPPQQPWAADPPNVLHNRRLPTGWSRHHLANRFMWLDGAEGVAEAFHGGENHGYLTFRAYAQALAACAVGSAARGTVAPPPGRLPAPVHRVSHSVIRDPTVHTRQDAQGEERKDTLSALSCRWTRACMPGCGATTTPSPWPSCSSPGFGRPPSCGWLPPRRTPTGNGPRRREPLS